MKKVIVTFLFLFFLIVTARAQEAEEELEDRYTVMREGMVNYQIKARGIKDPEVLKAMRTVKRHLFVPGRIKNAAYQDHPLPIGHRQTISQPYIVALMTELLDLSPEDKVLEIGTGSGYQAAVLAHIVKDVYSIEIVEPLADTSRELLKKLGYTNVHVLTGDGYRGWPQYAPFDAIIVTCAPDKIPPPLIEQLAEGGRLIIPLADTYPQRLVLVRKKDGKIEKEFITGVMFVPMTGEVQEDS